MGCYGQEIAAEKHRLEREIQRVHEVIRELEDLEEKNSITPQGKKDKKKFKKELKKRVLRYKDMESTCKDQKSCCCKNMPFLNFYVF